MNVDPITAQPLKGIPYSLSECVSAHRAYQRYMDEYMWHLMGWLIAEVKRLREPQSSGGGA